MDRRGLLVGGGVVAVTGALVGGSFATMGSSDAYAQAMAAQRAPFGPSADARDMIRYATLAANGHNTQPWRFGVTDRSISIVPDLTRRTPAVDPDDHHLYVSLGCAAENLSLAAAALGMPTEARYETSGDGAIVFDLVHGAASRSDLFAAIPRRQSARTPFDGRAVPVSALEALARAAAEPGVDLELITERAQIDRVRDLIIAGNTAQMADRAFVAELKEWVRFNPRAALARGDGLYSASSGNPALPDWLGPTMFDLTFKPDAENAKYAQQMDTASGVAVFVGAGETPAHWASVGRACQRFALQATALGLKLSFVNQPVEVAAMRPELAHLVGAPGRRPDIVMRFGYGPDMPMSPRRPVDAVIGPSAE